MKTMILVALMFAAFAYADELVQWGDSNQEQMQNFPSGNDFAQVYSGPVADHTAAIRDNGEILAWGADSLEQCNVFGTETNLLEFTCARDYTTWITSDSIFHCGEGAYSPPTYPSPFTDIASGMGQTIGIRENHILVGWGGGTFGEHIIPSEFVNAGMIGVGAGWHHSLAILPDGHAVAWGDNSMCLSFIFLIRLLEADVLV
jgi:alpha-tubulin suppressor-like RCC1 family protein